MKFKYLDKIGIEIEGGWNFQRDDLVPDAGIRLDEFKNSVCCGELISKPIKDLWEAVAFIKKNWPSETNSMSGLHFHFSFIN